MLFSNYPVGTVVNYFVIVTYLHITDGVYECRSDPVLQQSAVAATDPAQAFNPPSDGIDLTRPGMGVVRDGSIKNLVSTYENKVQEVCLLFCLHRPSFVLLLHSNLHTVSVPV